MAENIFQKVKELVDARELVKHILGEPVKISGNEHFWNSLNKNEKTPSLGANQDIISDFSLNDEMGTGLDICDFVAYYNNNHNHIVADKDISQIESLIWIVNEFNLDIDISSFTQTPNAPLLLKANEIQTIKTYSLEPTNNKPANGIATKFDTVPFNKKPNGDEVGQIKNRIDTIKGCEHTLEQLKEKLVNGYTCIPAGIKSKNDWVDGESLLQIFMVDIDNKVTIDGEEHKYTINDEKHVTVDKILKYCEEENLKPNFIYYTFSHSEEQHRFRLVFILYTPTRKKEEIEGVYTSLKEKFKDYNIDNSATDIARIFYRWNKYSI